MKSLTDQEKMKLVERLKKFRKGVQAAKDAHMATVEDEMDDNIAEIALAALTAKPVKIDYDYIFNALKEHYELEDDDRVREILYQSDDCINDICEALNQDSKQ